MLRNLKDVWGWIQRIVRRIERLESGAQLGNSSITKGRMRFIGGLLLIDSGGTLQIIGRLNGSGQFVWSGDWRFTGPGAITGDVVAEGKWTQNGPWEFNGPGDIAGDVGITGELNVDGPWNMNGPGDITGDVDVRGDLEVLDDGRVRVGGVTLTPLGGGRILIGTGSSQIILDTTQFRVGSAFRMDPSHSDSGAQMEFGTGDRPVRFYGGNDGATLSKMDGTTVESYIALRALADFTGVELFKNVRMPGLESLPQGKNAQYVVADDDGQLWLSAGVGGGGGVPEPGTDLGRFQWPFALSTVTSEYGPRWGRMHEGIDFGIAPAVAGAPIIAAGDGVVAVRTFSSGWGNYVRLTHTLPDGQQVSTLYGHMVNPAPVAVGQTVKKGDIIGHVGNTGNSFGAHLHFETWMTTSYGSHVNPRSFMAAYGPA